STFAKISIIPVHFRKQPIKTVYEQYNGKLPTVFEKIAEEDTHLWHFTNKTYPDRNCSKQNGADVIWAINTLKPLFKSEKDDISKSVTLMMLTHYIEDIHQPLHT